VDAMNTKTDEGLSAETIAEMIAQLSDGLVLRRQLPGGGRIHIDRLQPFVCVYRDPESHPDVGTADLLLGQASHILTSGAKQHHTWLKALVTALSQTIIETYGAVLILELWSAPDQPAATPHEARAPARFRIVAARHGVPDATIETLERTLLTATAAKAVEFDISYRSGAAPPKLAPLLTAQEEERTDAFLLGLEVPPLYRDPETGKVMPAELRRFTGSLGRALRQTFYTFAHARAHYRPTHFEELGRRAMTRAVAVADEGLAEVGDSFDLLLHATPVNTEAAYHSFVESDCQDIPEFLYRPQTVDPGALKYALYKVPIERIEDPALYHLFASQRDELDRMITMIADRGTPLFLLESQQVFGCPDAALLATARGLLDALPPTQDASAGKTVDATHFSHHAERELAHYRKAWPDLPARVEVREDVPGLMVSRGHFLVGHNAQIPYDRIEATLHHEIGTHILTYYNGLQQPLSQFHTGMPGYEETQEGLAVLSEYLSGGLTPSRLRLIGGRVVAVDSIVQGADFIETFQLLHDMHGFGRRAAFTIAMRVHRGGGLTKDAVYLRGLIGVLDHLAAGHAFADLMLGKIALEHIEIVEELRWRRVVSPGPLKPRYLNDPSAAERLAGLPSGKNLLALVDGATG
jgi:uncharacterized protein (TIGR02421 family)